MAKTLKSVEAAIKELERLARRRKPPAGARIVLSGKVPEDLRSEGFERLGLFGDEGRVLDELRALLPDDLRFEHLKKQQIDDATWRFMSEAHLRRSDAVANFMEANAREPFRRECFLPIELLTVSKEVALLGVRLLPSGDLTLPGTFLGPDPRPTVASVGAVVVIGTDHTQMALRARADLEQAMRVLRATLRADRWIPDRQLRFRIGPSVWFDDNFSGWTAPADLGWELELDDALISQVIEQPLAALAAQPSTDVERRADLALRWYERAQLAQEPVVEVLYLFFALETILGEKSAKLKGHVLAMRRALLGLEISGHFRHPSNTYLLYDEVRSAAVHGEQVPQIGRQEVDAFELDVREAINEFLTFARSRNLVKRSKVRDALDADSRRQKLADQLAKEDPRRWNAYAHPPGEQRSPGRAPR
jgi:hypothetical protein